MDKLNVYRKNEENITIKYQTLINAMKEETSNPKIESILAKARSEENKIVKEEEDSEAFESHNKFKYEGFSDQVCSVWKEAYEATRNLCSSKVDNKEIEEKINKLYNLLV